MIIELDDTHDGAGASGDRLAVLPDELLLQIFETLGRSSKRSLCAVSLLNKKYHNLSDAVLYKSILFNTPELHLTFSESLGRRPRRGSAIHEIKLAYPSSELSQLALDRPIHGSYVHPSRFEGLSRTLSIMSNLEMLDVSVPDVLLHGIGSLFNGPFDLTYLKSCTLFYQCANDGYWDLRENIHIFAHPTLESLTIRRARFDEQGFDFLEKPHETGLKKLVLIECDINDDGLSDLLEFPEALEEFVLTQLEEPSPDLEESSDSLADYILALKSQAASLTSITIDSPSLGCRKTLRMREFAAVKTLRVNWDYQLFGKSSKKPRLHSLGLPPELEVLELFNELGTDDEVTDLFVNFIENRDTVARRWKKMIVVGDDDGNVCPEIKRACQEHGLQLDIIGAMEGDSNSDTDPE
ncbi:F-box domain-containing protein [Dendryphion nanum]|uniref:F-box domain-containing protein n=1 Tax=Dendryphion nanum TaxID=256645 RepID=A0A9P9DVZ3_9PLEO|nr:F-box domain-containing protein [Dendryphion nanum]